MARLLAHARFIIGAAMLLLAVALAPPALAQGQLINPTASSVQESKLLEELNRISGRCTLPDQKACTIEQPAGRQWRDFHEVTLPWIGGALIIGVVVLLALFYFVRGPLMIEGGRSGRTMQRFNAFERVVHWTVAVSFVVLAISGLNITFGKSLLLPLIGPEAFSTWSEWAKYAHNYLSFAFTIGVIFMALMWIGNNFPTAADVQWLKKGGGFVGHEHPPAWKFNAGQKMLFWFIVFGTIAVAVSGYFLMFPFYFTDIAGMQLAQIVHGLVGVLFATLIIAHIYIGTLGMEGAFEAMTDGNVDLNWAKQHHPLWVEQELGKGHVTGLPSGASATPAE